MTRLNVPPNICQRSGSSARRPPEAKRGITGVAPVGRRCDPERPLGERWSLAGSFRSITGSRTGGPIACAKNTGIGFRVGGSMNKSAASPRLLSLASQMPVWWLTSFLVAVARLRWSSGFCRACYPSLLVRRASLSCKKRRVGLRLHAARCGHSGGTWWLAHRLSRAYLIRRFAPWATWTSLEGRDTRPGGGITWNQP